MRIAFALPQAAAVKIEVFDLLGRRAALLDPGTLPAGGHALPWNGANLPSGVYLLKISAGGQTAAAKAVLVK